MLLLGLASLALAGCSSGIQTDGRHGVYYEIFVGSFYDSDGDGMGDFNGIAEKLDYINDGDPSSSESLHADGIWLMPIMPSPSYHKYDVVDYKNVDPAYGTMGDFEKLLGKCRERGVSVIIDLPLNHTSSQHPWFLGAASELSKGKPGKLSAYYNIKETQSTNCHPFTDAGLADIPGYFYEGLFVGSMPDLNMDNPDVRREVESITKFWLEKGVSGFRLDALKHVYNDQGKNIDFIGWYSEHCQSVKEGAYLVGEVWGSAAEISAYYSGGITSLFNFPYAQEAGVIANAVNTESGSYFARNLANWSKTLGEHPGAVDAPFLSNHDNDRSSGYFTDLSKRKTAAALCLFMPGNPFVYYGEEIGMSGSGKDENKRAPFIWDSSDATGETKGPLGMDPPLFLPAGAAQQLSDDSSLLRFYIDAIKLRKEHPAISLGTVEQIESESAVAAYRATHESGAVSIYHNLSSEPQTALVSSGAVSGWLNAGEKAEPTLSGTELTIPALTTVVITE
jgi:glycosidase